MSNHIIWIVPIIAVPFAFIATLLLIFISRKFNLFKNNIEKAPLVGGLAIYTVLFLLTLIFEMPKKIESIVFISSIIVLTGFLDDIIILSAKLRLLIHLFASLLLIYVTNLYIIDISFILFENKDSLSIIGIIITLLIVIGLTNGFNFIDGIDGLSAGQALITIVLIVIIQALTDNYYQIFYLSILSALLLTYLMFNLSAFKFEKIFLGDAGSTLLGFTISWALIYFTQPPISTFNPIFAIWCVTLPVYDLFYVILKRISIKKSPMAGDRNHLHYKLVDEGLNKKFVLILYLIISFSISLIGIMISDFLDPLISFSFYFICLILYCLFMFNFNSVIKFIKSYYL